MIELISEMFSYTFMTRAFVSGLLLSLCASLLGTPLVLKRYSMIGDGLSHIGFGALAVAAVMNLTPLYVAIPVVSVAAVLLLRLSENSSLKGDSAVALISTASLAIGVIAVSVGSGINIDLNSYLFGSILSMSQTDLYASIAISAVVLLLFTVFYNRIFCVTFDESFASASGVRAGAYNVLVALLAALTIVVGMKLMGAMLISALIIFPSVTSMRLFRSFRGVVISSVAVSAVCFTAGIFASYVWDIPPGASIVVTNLAALLIFSVVSFFKSGGFSKLFGKLRGIGGGHS